MRVFDRLVVSCLALAALAVAFSWVGLAVAPAYAQSQTQVRVFGVGPTGLSIPLSATGGVLVPARPFKCVSGVQTATTIQALGGDCATPGAGFSLYVTDVSFDASASGIAADAFPTLKSGTGGTCGTGTAVVWTKMSATAVTVTQTFTTPLKLTAAHELCWIATTVGSKAVSVTGFIAP